MFDIQALTFIIPEHLYIYYPPTNFYVRLQKISFEPLCTGIHRYQYQTFLFSFISINIRNIQIHLLITIIYLRINIFRHHNIIKVFFPSFLKILFYDNHGGLITLG